MAKLVKLTTTIDKLRDTNSYLSICNDDILVEPNSKVSLLNAHISSGLQANYEIKGTDSIGQVASGEIVGNITLGPGDRERDIIIPNSTYSINQLINAMENQMNNSLVFESTCTRTAGTNLDTVKTLDFNLETGMQIATDTNCVQIDYNSAPQKMRADLKFSNKSTGIVIDSATGDISYGTPSGYQQALLDKTQATRDTAVTTDILTGIFSRFETVNLVDSTGTFTHKAVVIDDINVTSTNLTTAITLDTTKTDVPNSVVFGTLPATQTNPFAIGQDVTLDDGTGVAGTPSANVIHATVANAELVMQNPMLPITELALEKLQDLELEYNIIGTPLPVSGIVGRFTMQIANPFINAAANHLVADALHYLINPADEVYAVGQIISSAADPNDPQITNIVIVIEALSPQPLEVSQLAKLRTAEFLFSEDGKAPTYITPISRGELGLFDSNRNILSYVNLAADPVINAGEDYITFEVTPGAWNYWDGTSNLVDQGLVAFKKWALATVKKPGFAFAQLSVTNTDRVIVSQVGTAAAFPYAINTQVTLFEDGFVNPYIVTIISAPYDYVDGTNNYVVIPIEMNPNNIELYYSFYKALIPSANDWNVSLNMNQLRKLTLANLDAVLSATQTRLWIGTDITQVTQIKFVIPPRTTIVVPNFDIMVKGSDNVTQEQSLAVEDTRLSHSCGRMAFVVVAVGACEFGVVPESFSFNTQTPSSSTIKIKIINGTSGNPTYALYRNNTRVSMKGELLPLAGDTVIIQWGVTPTSADFEYTEAINGASNKPDVTIAKTRAGTSDFDADRGKILISVVRAGASVPPRWIHLGSINANPLLTNPDQERLAKCIPWTPRSNPYVQPIYWDNSVNVRMFVCPNRATIRPMELSPSSQLISDTNGVVSKLNGVSAVFHPDYHTSSNLDDTPNKFTAFNSVFAFQFTAPTFQKLLGYKTSFKQLDGLTGFWQADISYLKAYLPEGVVILLENIGAIDTYDCGQFNGTRRQIIGTAVNTQDKIGEIAIEPNNLYRIALNNKNQMNLRKFSVAFEDLNGDQLILQNAKVSVCLLFEP